MTTLQQEAKQNSVLNGTNLNVSLQPKPQIICCSYQNRSPTPQVLKFQTKYTFFERTVYPGVEIHFVAPADARIEVHSTRVTTVLEDILMATKLR